MTEFRTFCALISYPALIMFIWEPVGSRWVKVHRSLSLPADIKQKSEKNARHLLFVKYALLLASLCLLVGGHPWTLIHVASASHSWSTLVLLGAGGGVLLLICMRLLALGLPSIAAAELDHPNLEGPIFFWLAVFVFGGFAEEFWRALCMAALQQNDCSSVLANVLTAGAFSIARISGRPPRTWGGGDAMIAEFVIGLVLGVVFLKSGSLLTLYLASLVYNTSNFCWLRHRYAQPAEV